MRLIWLRNFVSRTVRFGWELWWIFWNDNEIISKSKIDFFFDIDMLLCFCGCFLAFGVAQIGDRSQ